MKRLFALTATLGLSMAMATGAVAQYPEEDIRLIVPFSPGGNTDLFARIVAEPLAERLDGTIYVDNRPGGGAVLGSELAANSDPDGYTLLFNSGSHTINESTRDLPYDTLEDFDPISRVVNVSNVLVAHPDVPADSGAELVEYAKENPGELNYGSAGVGTSSNLGFELFKREAGVDIVHIPYPGNADARADLISGALDVMMGAQPAAMGYIESGDLKPLAVTSAERSPVLPDVPTVDECCAPGFELSQNFGILVPAGTPEEIVAKLNEALVEVINSEEVHDRLVGLGATPAPTTPDEYRALIEENVERWATLVDEMNVELD